MELSKDVQTDLHYRMVRIRLFEEAAGRLAEDARDFQGFCTCTSVRKRWPQACAAALNDDDHITSTHRGHGHLVAKGGDFNRMMAELMGKSTGYCKGKGGSMHISDLALGMLGANGIVGAGSPIAVGAAFANRYRGRGQVAVAFFGDGATNIGAFHEAANMACALRLPIVFACENNEYAEFTRRSDTMAITDIVDRAAGYGMPGVIVDGMDVAAVHEVAIAAVEHARNGAGPTLIEAKTYRYYNHHGIQNLGLKYRADDEVAEWKQRDPIPTYEARLIEAGTMSRSDLDAVWEGQRDAIASAIAFAEQSPVPEPDQLLVDVYTSRRDATPVGEPADELVRG